MRRHGYRWRRLRLSLRWKRQQSSFDEAHQQLAELRQQHQQGQLRLFYVDESGFSLQPPVPYAWQKASEGRHPACNACVAHRERYNVLGFLSPQGEFHSYTSPQSISSELVVACIEQFIQDRRADGDHRRIVLVLDNASVHTSALLEDRVSLWQQAGVELKYLPAYSPELNLIEILCKRIKYHWLPLDARDSWHRLTESVDEVLRNIGRKYQITFS